MIGGEFRLNRKTLVLLVLLVLAAAVPGAAAASGLIDRNATQVRLAVDASGRATLSYRARGKTLRVVAWGAVDAVPPTGARPQVTFRLDYSGRAAPKRFHNRCLPYDGPPISWLVTACKAPDGSYWAVQSWQRLLPNYGLQATGAQAVRELRLSHWTGETAVLELGVDWAYRAWDHVFGRYTYRGTPVYGFSSTPAGVPLDTYGRNIYLDTYDSAYGSGWKRENSFLAHTGSGAFCYGFFPHDKRPSGKGERYRATAIGPGVTPDVTWEGASPGLYNRQLDQAANERIAQLGSSLCKPN